MNKVANDKETVLKNIACFVVFSVKAVNIFGEMRRMQYFCNHKIKKMIKKTIYSLLCPVALFVTTFHTLILLVGNQHTQGEVLMRYYHVMRPFLS